ncbi:MAG TPA: aminotransferase class I/II-fold pyridoxal phosphate-dependent enzyme [Anaerolineales bacterium]|nr:aminotransferase class I/II-fold pyridoxal phosphate-dependent enzyme [Anaerolineales bacterium]
MLSPARRLERSSTQFFADLNQRVARLQAEGHDIIRLDIGSPDLPPAAHIIQALAKTAASPDRHGYQPHNATPALRQAWVEMYQRLYGVELDPNTQAVPLLGSKEGIFHLALALVEEGSLVLIPDPGYLTYTQGTLLSGGEPYYLSLERERGFLPDLAAVPPEIARRARLLWLNYPNNPTAAVASREFFAEAVEFARTYDLLVCHDAAYAQVAFDGYQPPSILEAPGALEVAVEFNTLSKSHNMAGWRVGAALGNPEALRWLYKIKTNADSGHFLPILEAATAALTGDQSWLEVRNQVYSRRRDLLVAGLRRLGFSVESPRASLYVWCPVPEGWSSSEFAAAVLDKAHVSLTPGVVFGQSGEGYVRITLTQTEEHLKVALQRLENWMGKDT